MVVENETYRGWLFVRLHVESSMLYDVPGETDTQKNSSQ